MNYLLWPFVAFSLFVHILVFSVFFRYDPLPGDPTKPSLSYEEDSTQVDKNTWDFSGQDFDVFKSALSPFFDSSAIDSLWQKDSQFIQGVLWNNYIRLENTGFLQYLFY